VRIGSPDYNFATNKEVGTFTLHPKFKITNLDFDAAILVLRTPLADSGDFASLGLSDIILNPVYRTLPNCRDSEGSEEKRFL
jgi:hypothetical protein